MADHGIHRWSRPATHPQQQLTGEQPYIAPEPLPHAHKFRADPDPGSDNPLATQHRPVATFKVLAP